MNPDNERIEDLPGRQVSIVFDQDILIKRNNNAANRGSQSLSGGLVGLRILVDGEISVSYLFDAAPGPAFPVSAGDVVVARIRQVHAAGTTLAVTDMIGLA